MGRLTKNFFKEEIKKNYNTAKKLLPTILKRYGEATKVSPRKSYYRLWLDNDDCIEGYNHGMSWWINGFELSAKGTLYIMVYWQGDSTDGDEYIEIPAGYTSAFLPPSKPVNMGSYYYTARQGIDITPDEIWEAIKNLKF